MGGTIDRGCEVQMTTGDNKEINRGEMDCQKKFGGYLELWWVVGLCSLGWGRKDPSYGRRVEIEEEEVRVEELDPIVQRRHGIKDRTWLAWEEMVKTIIDNVHSWPCSLQSVCLLLRFFVS